MEMRFAEPAVARRRWRNRDTTWFSVIDRDWPALRAAFERWLDPGNFAADGRQRRRLADLRSGAG